ncbi:MAG: ABC transporter permease subunit, partial [Alphaproteobacteria bacterium]|nr:ABC transporter permease subunit [Alphaproteobacteria bacterium]
GIFNVPVFARLTRGAALPLWKREFVLAARAAARSDAAISIDHILPNVAAVLIVQATIQFALAIVAEAGLSYVGLGSLPSEPSWGKMLNEAQTYIYTAPLLAVFPGLAITVSVLGLNLLGDGLRDMLDPRVRRGRG